MQHHVARPRCNYSRRGCLDFDSNMPYSGGMLISQGCNMRTLSRWMPPAKNATMSSTFLLLAGIVTAVLAAYFISPIHGIGVVGAILLTILFDAFMDRRLRRLAELRPGEDIGTFARSFDRRAAHFDPWVIRATWDTLQPYVQYRGGSVPLRATDRFVELPVDPDDLYLDLLVEVAERTGHTLVRSESNEEDVPLDTVGDFVRFISSQPRKPR
jgi:hypothetical protein